MSPQAGERRVVEVLAVGKRGQRARASPVEPRIAFALPCRQAAKLGDQLTHGAHPPAIGIVGDVAGDQALKVRSRVPVRRGRVRRLPFGPRRVGRLSVERSPNQSTVIERWGFSQAYWRQICKN